MNLNPDFSDLLKSFNAAGVRYLLVGAYACAYHAEPRPTKSLDLWTEPTRRNAVRVWRALRKFGTPLKAASWEDFAMPQTVYQIGVEPNRVDIHTSAAGIDFARGWRNSVIGRYGAIPIRVLGRRDLIASKGASGSRQDLADIKKLTPRRKKPGKPVGRKR